MSQLNAAQQAAARALNGAVLLDAGAGSGKTKTLAERFCAALLPDEEQGWVAASADEILTITFTEKAAGELAERVRAILRTRDSREHRRVESAWISTIHGFCSKLLRRYAIEAGIDPSFAVVDDLQASRLSEEAFERAASQALGAPEGERLFAAFEFADVYKAAMRIAQALRSRGLEAEHLQAASRPRIADVVDRASRMLHEGGTEIEACDCSKPTSRDLATKCRLAAQALSELDERTLSSADLAFKAWEVLAAWTPGRSNGAIVEVRERLAQQHANLLAEAASCAAAPIVDGMRDLVALYLDEYRELKRAQGVLDFDDLQNQTAQLLESCPEVRKRCQKMFRAVMVDEFQDTDELQERIVSQVSTGNICTVGDPCQSIYGFRGADLRVYHAHVHAMESSGAQRFALVENYRSHPEILSFVNGVFGSEVMFGRVLTRLRPGRVEPVPPVLPDDQPRVELITVDANLPSSDARAVEARAVARRLADLHEHFGIPAEHMAVLLRTYRHAGEYAEALTAVGLDSSIVGGSRFFGLPEVKMMRALAAAIANPLDDEALLHVLASDLGRVSDDGLLRLASARREAPLKRALWECLPDACHLLPEIDARRVDAVRQALESAHTASGQMPMAEVLLAFAERCALDLTLIGDGSRGRQAYANVLKFARLADAYEANGGSGAAGFVRHVDARQMYGDHIAPATIADEDTGAVRIMSVHASKGLEFPVVVHAGLGDPAVSDRDFVRISTEHPNEVRITARLAQKAKDGRNRPAEFQRYDEEAKVAEAAEAQRVFYVACTRARDVLILAGVTDWDKDASELSDAPLTWLRRAWPGLQRLDEGKDVTLSVGPDETRIRLSRADDTGSPADEASALAERYEPEVEHADTRVAAERTRIPMHLSFSDIALYQACAKRYHGERVMRIGRLAEHRADHALSFGTAVHEALQIVGPGGETDPQIIRRICRYYRLAQEQAGRMARAVENGLGAAAARRCAAMGIVRREWSFGVRLDGAGPGTYLIGSVDVYGRSARRGLIIDYKTGDGRGESDDARYRLQARCYALAALRDGCNEVTVAFVHVEQPNPDGEARTVEFDFTANEAGDIEREIALVHARMLAGEFEPLEVWAEHVCGPCPLAGELCRTRNTAGPRVSS